MQSTFDKIITDLYGSSELNLCIARYIKPEDRDDFKHIVFSVLLAQDKELIIGLKEKNQLNYYVARIVLNQKNWKRGEYHKNYTILDHDRKLKQYLFDGGLDDTDEQIHALHHKDLRKNLAHIQSSQNDFTEREEREEKEIKLIKAIDDLDDQMTDKSKYPVYRRIIELIHQYGSLRKVSEVTGIPKSTLHNCLKKSREFLKKKIA